MIDFYFYPTSTPCRAVVLTATAIGLDMNYKELPVLTGDYITPEFLEMNPQHTVPTINDNGFCLWESRAIMAYLVDTYGKDDSLYPKDLKKRAVVNQRLFFDGICLYPAVADYFFPLIGNNTYKDRIDERDEKIDSALELLNTFLNGEDYVAGKNMTIADLSIIVTIAMIEVMDYSLSKYSNITKWLAKLKSEIPKYEELERRNLQIIRRRAYEGLFDELNRLKKGD